MSKIGLILACPHYPDVSDKPEKIDAQLRIWLGVYGTDVTEIEVYEAHAGYLPRHAASCDAWIVSGLPLPCADPKLAEGRSIAHFLLAAAALGRTIYALNHAEHLLHDALASGHATPPTTGKVLRSIRNPFRSFHSRDTLHRYNPATKAIDALQRPETLCSRRLFGTWSQAA